MKWSAGALRRVVREAFIAAWRTAPIPLRVVGLIGPFVLFGAVRAFVGGWLAAGIVLVLAALVVVLLLAAYGLAVEAEAAASEPRPYLVFVGTETKPAITVSPVRAVSPGVAAGYASTATAYPSQPPVEHVRNDFARVLVANDPPVGARAVRADRVTGRVEFYDEHGTLCLEIQGRWSETRQRGERSSLSVSYESVQLDIDANGLPPRVAVTSAIVCLRPPRAKGDPLPRAHRSPWLRASPSSRFGLVRRFVQRNSFGCDRRLDRRSRRQLGRLAGQLLVPRRARDRRDHLDGDISCHRSLLDRLRERPLEERPGRGDDCHRVPRDLALAHVVESGDRFGRNSHEFARFFVAESRERFTLRLARRLTRRE